MKGIALLSLTVLTVIVFVGCIASKKVVKNESQEDEKEMSRGVKNEPICGGVTDNTDVNAPKTINSKNIISFSAAFVVRDKYDYDKIGYCNVKIEDNEKGEHVLKLSGLYNHDTVVDNQVLVDVQAIIDKCGLVKKNGAGRVTAGLPLEWQPWSLNVNYDSGERLHFYENGAPEAEWTTEFRDYFVDVMAKAGYEDMLPPKEARTIKDFSFSFNIEGDYHSYCLIRRQDDETIYLWHYAYDMDTMDDKLNEFAAVTDTLFEGLQEVVEANGMDVLNKPESVGSDFEQSKDGFLEINIDYVSGRWISGEYESSELPDEWPGMKTALVEFFDNYFQENLSFTEPLDE